MPMPVLTREEQTAAMEAASSDLKFLLAELQMPELLQGVFYHLGFTNVPLFAGLDRNENGVRDFLQRDFGVDPANGLADRRTVSLVVTAWEEARALKLKQMEVKVEARAAGQRAPIDLTEHTQLRRGYEARWGALTNAETPSKAYVELRLEETEQNAPQAEALNDITSVETASTDQMLGAELSANGMLRVRSATRARGKVPRDAEELRMAHKLLGNSWLFVQQKHHNRAWLSDLTAACMVKFSDYLLGPQVAGLEAKSNDIVLARPSFPLVLAFEHQIRKKVMENVRAGQGTIATNLVSVPKDTELKELHFLTPFRFQSSASGVVSGVGRQMNAPTNAGAGSPWALPSPTSMGSPGRAKGCGKNLTKGRTADGRLICYTFNNPDRSCPGTCNMIHVCLQCHQKGHKGFECPNPPVQIPSGKGGGKQRGRGGGKPRGKRRPGDSRAGEEEQRSLGRQDSGADSERSRRSDKKEKKKRRRSTSSSETRAERDAGNQRR